MSVCVCVCVCVHVCKNVFFPLLSKGQISFHVPQLQRLLELRASSVEQCNMLLLLLIVSVELPKSVYPFFNVCLSVCQAKLEFNLPLKVMDSTLETARLSHIE